MTLKGTIVVPSQSTDDRLADLSAFQLRVLRLMATGLSNTAIATQLGISRRAVENHVSRLLHALGLVQDDAIAVRVCAVLIYLKHTDSLKVADNFKVAEAARRLDPARAASRPKRLRRMATADVGYDPARPSTEPTRSSVTVVDSTRHRTITVEPPRSRAS